MKPVSDRALVHDIVVILCLKIVAIFILWWAFVKDQRVEVDPGGVAAKFMSQPFNVQPAAKGEPHGR